MKLKILKSTEKSFTGNDGEVRDYYWYVGEMTDGTAIRFGSTRGSHIPGGTVDITLEKYSNNFGKVGYKELVDEEQS